MRFYEVKTRMENAADRVWRCSPRFVCPLCLGSTDRSPTREHVPAKKLGGTVLTLTCGPCNQRAGSLLQPAQLRRAEVEFQTPVGQARGELKWEGNVRHINVPQSRNDPSVIEYILDAGRSDTPCRIGELYEPRWPIARIADLRDAYLWAFAYFGYTLIATPAFDWIRNAIRSPTENTNRKFALNMGVSSSEPCMFVLGAPAPGALIVLDGSRAVVLPTPFCPAPYMLFADDKRELSLASRPIRVPRRTLLRWDQPKFNRMFGR